MGLKSFLFGPTKTQSPRIEQKMRQKYLDTKCPHQASSISNSPVLCATFVSFFRFSISFFFFFFLTGHKCYRFSYFCFFLFLFWIAGSLLFFNIK